MLYIGRTLVVKGFCTPRELPACAFPVHHMYMMQTRAPSRARPKKPKVYRRTFIRAYRLRAEISLEDLAEAVGERTGDGMTHASLSRIERGLQPYSQPILEAIADVLGISTTALLGRDPDAPDIWSTWEHATRDEQRKIADIARTIIRKPANG